MRTILILDDDQAVRQSLADYFEDHLWHALQAESAEEALLVVDREHPVAAIVDVRLPGMDGGTFVDETIRRNVPIAIVICTGSSDFRISPELLNHPRVAPEVFKKPLTDFEPLQATIDQIVDDMTMGEGIDKHER